MKRKEYPGGWIKHGNVYGFPFRWQVPAKTELWAYEKCLEKENINIFEQYFCFPWAGLVDCIKHNQPLKAKLFLDALDVAPPKSAVKRVTFCQHIYALNLLPYFKMLGITDIYWSHKIKGQDEIEGIKLHPYPLYPVMHYKRSKPYTNKPLSERKYLYSFIGAYQPDLYLTPVRKWIFDLPERNDAIVIERNEWHFEQDVYRNQLLGATEAVIKSKVRKQYEKEYIDVMQETVFCLCPSGSGPNSIRLWEAIKFGCIPVLISDSLELPNNEIGKVITVPEELEVITKLPHELVRKRALFDVKPDTS
jgi:hypothetical protein